MNPLEFLKMFGGMPDNFRPSFLSEEHKKQRVLPGSVLEPKVDISGVNVAGVKQVAQVQKVQ